MKSNAISRLGETFSFHEQCSPWDLKPIPIIKPSFFDQNNPPGPVVEVARKFNHSTQTFWCYFHGQYCVTWEERENQVDWGTCQCPGCIQEEMFYTGMKK